VKTVTPYALVDWPRLCRELRRVRGETQQGIAVRLRVSAGSWSRWERGATQPHGLNAAALLRAARRDWIEVRDVYDQEAAL
jgi:transcriptional regulator with XRE-family HTH domain